MDPDPVMTEEEVREFLVNNSFVHALAFSTNGFNTIIVCHALDASVNEYLRNHEANIVYSDTDCFIVLKY
jgi:gluconate kinase